MNVIWDMTIGEIGQIVGLSTAVIVSLILGVKALRQTKELQDRQLKHSEEARQREYKQRMLDEIIAWAVDVSNSYAVRPDDSEDYRAGRGRIAYVSNLEYRFKLLENRSRYIRLVANRIDSTLGDIVLEVLGLMEELKRLSWVSVSGGSFPPQETERVAAIIIGKETDTTGLSEGALNALSRFRSAVSLNSALDRIIGKAVDIKMQSIR
jgi:hypothetical protein